MARTSPRPARFLTTFTAATCFLVVSALGNEESDVIAVEEHWQLNVGIPDAGRNAPQVTMFMSPVEHLGGDYFSLTLNHWTYPDFIAGGYQLQRWWGSECVTARHGIKTSQLYHDDETISWVQRLSVDDGVLKFQVFNGTSNTWGKFGGYGFALEKSTNLTKLNAYRPGISIEQSGIGYAGNRVSSLTLQKLRWTTANGVDHEMVAPIDIDTDLDP